MPKKRQPPASTTAAFYIEQQLDDWFCAHIRGEPWQAVMPDKPVFIRRREVLRRVGVSHVTIWTWEREGRFPKAIRLNEVGNKAA